MARKKWYLVLDTETATLPFSDSIAENAKEKQRIAIAKPLVYDLGYVIVDRNGNTKASRNFLIQETFFVHLVRTLKQSLEAPEGFHWMG